VIIEPSAARADAELGITHRNWVSPLARTGPFPTNSRNSAIVIPKSPSFLALMFVSSKPIDRVFDHSRCGIVRRSAFLPGCCNAFFHLGLSLLDRSCSDMHPLHPFSRRNAVVTGSSGSPAQARRQPMCCDAAVADEDATDRPHRLSSRCETSAGRCPQRRSAAHGGMVLTGGM
jgi:hypothetical protein